MGSQGNQMSDRFNEGLAKDIEHATLAERERIIKLLEGNLATLTDFDGNERKWIGWQYKARHEPVGVADLIALIKGENK
jgi:hypothetical protein